jgi:intein/homing endonuclease
LENLAQPILKHPLLLKRAKNKRIPNWVFESKPSIKLAVIEGFHDADGCDRSKMSGGIWSSSVCCPIVVISLFIRMTCSEIATGASK